jgi:nitroreductase
VDAAPSSGNGSSWALNGKDLPFAARRLFRPHPGPSAGNQQAWDFVVCTDREQLGQLARVWRSAGHVARSAATIALVAPSPTTAAGAT